MVSSRSDRTGPRLTDVLERAWKTGFSTKSDFARSHADLIAMGASEGYLTTKIAAGYFGRQWQITPAGLRHLWAIKGMEEHG